MHQVSTRRQYNWTIIIITIINNNNININNPWYIKIHIRIAFYFILFTLGLDCRTTVFFTPKRVACFENDRDGMTDDITDDDDNDDDDNDNNEDDDDNEVI